VEIAIVFSMCTPAYAVDFDGVIGAIQVAPDFGSWVWSAIKTGNSTFKWLTGDTDYCPGSGEQPGFNYRHDFIIQDTIVGSKAGTYYICKNCGLSAGEVLEPAYNDYVQNLPAQGIDSSGGLIYSVLFTGLRLGVSWDPNSPEEYISFGYDSTPGTATVASLESYYGCPISLSGSATSFDVSFASNSSRLAHDFRWHFFFMEKAPVSGTYVPVQKTVDFYLYDTNGAHLSDNKDLWNSLQSRYCVKGANLPGPTGYSHYCYTSNYFRCSRFLIEILISYASVCMSGLAAVAIQ